VVGVKSAVAVGLAGIGAGVAAWRGRLAIEHLSTLGPTACFAIGLFAGVATALVAIGVRPRLPSRLAIGVRDRRVVVAAVADAPRDLPPAMQRALWIVAFASVGLAVFTNPGTARLVALPSDMAEPSAGEYCKEKEAETEPSEPAPPPKPVEIPGCALVKRAVALGYAKSLGSCAPKDAPPAVKTAIAAQAPCTLRQLDEPFLHYAYRRLSGAGGAIAGASPVEMIEHEIDEKQIQLDHLDTLMASQRHSIVGTPHASHHVFVTLPDPDPPTLVERVVHPPRCDDRYAELPLWPAPSVTAGGLFDHVLGQLLFAARFGTTASCGDYVVHWSARADACAWLRQPGVIANDETFEGVHEVLDRRRRRLELAELDAKLGRKTPPPPPDARTVVSFTCVAIDPAATAPVVSGGDVLVDGEPISVRELRLPAIRTTGAGVIELYLALATALGGEDTAPAVIDAAAPSEPPPDQGELDRDDFRLVRLDRLHDTDPFRGVRWPLDRGDLLEVYPLPRQLRTFVDGFRRRYRAQRGRL
jgi:hypothetical protein